MHYAPINEKPKTLQFTQCKYAGPPYSQTKIYPDHKLRSSSSYRINTCCPYLTSAANPPAATAAIN